MVQFVLGRLVAVVPVLVLVTAGVFLLIHLTPGDPIDAMMAESADPGVKAELSRQLGLDQPIHVQYLRWMGRLLRGDLGRSIRNNQPVIEDVSRRLRPSLIRRTTSNSSRRPCHRRNHPASCRTGCCRG